MIKTEASFREYLKTFIWNAKLGFGVSPFLYILMATSRILNVTLPIAVTYVAALIIDEIVYLQSNLVESISPRLQLYIVLLFAFAILNKIADNLEYYSFRHWRYLWDMKIWTKYIEKQASLDFQYVENPQFEELNNKAKEAIDWRAVNLAEEPLDILQNVIGLSLIIGIIVSINPAFLIFLLVPIVLNLIINRKAGKEIHNFWGAHSEVKSDSWNAHNAYSNNDVLRESKIYNFSEVIINRYVKAQYEFIDSVLGKLRLKYMLNTLSGLLEGIILIGIQTWLITEILRNAISIGDYTFYLTNFGRVSDKLNDIESIISSTMDNIQYVHDFRIFMELPEIIKEDENPVLVEEKPPSIEFKNVSFSYPQTGTLILDNVSFKVNPKEKVALVGRNGAGKTTLIKLLARFYDVDSGEILINDKNIKKIDRKSYYKLWGVLFQHFAKLWLCVRENIGLGNIEDIKNLELIEEAAKKAGIHEDVEKLKRNTKQC